jgi:hypothetical protein
LSVEVGVTSIEAYGRGYVAIDVQLLVSLLDGEDHKEGALEILWEAFCCQNEALKSTSIKRSN